MKKAPVLAAGWKQGAIGGPFWSSAEVFQDTDMMEAVAAERSCNLQVANSYSEFKDVCVASKLLGERSPKNPARRCDAQNSNANRCVALVSGFLICLI